MQTTTRTRAKATALAIAALFAAAAAKAAPTTRVMLFFDTEDYTCDRSNDAIRDIANLLTEEGVRGNFNIAGYLAGRLVELGRSDVIAALRPHVIGSQTLYHTRHPDLAELGDAPDYERAYRDTLRDEARAFGMIEAVFGEGRCIFWCPPGNCVSAVAMDVYSDLGVPFAAGTAFDGPTAGGPYDAFLARPGRRKLGLWYANQYHIPYSLVMTLESFMPRDGKPCPDFKPSLDALAKRDFAGLYMHPHIAVKKQHWDGPNYKGGNLVPWRQWKQVEDRPPADTAEYYRRFRAFIRAVKADGRFAFSDLEALRATLMPRVAIATNDLPAIRASLEKEFGPIRSPASWCVTDVFQAVVRLLRGEAPATPGKAYGFLERPRGVTTATDVAADDLRAAAAQIDLATFIPPAIRVGSREIGPADFLFAALEVLTTGAKTVTTRPREQLGSFKEVPGLEKMNIANSWCHTKDFKDAHLSERLRLQLWTLRLEPEL